MVMKSLRTPTPNLVYPPKAVRSTFQLCLTGPLLWGEDPAYPMITTQAPIRQHTLPHNTAGSSPPASAFWAVWPCPTKFPLEIKTKANAMDQVSLYTPRWVGVTLGYRYNLAYQRHFGRTDGELPPPP